MGNQDARYGVLDIMLFQLGILLGDLSINLLVICHRCGHVVGFTVFCNDYIVCTCVCSCVFMSYIA